ncbi:MAG: creatininase family protein [Bdellovibrionota bacterium]
MKGIHLENLNWQEAETELKRRKIVVLPVGARLKEHGLHLPLNNDWNMAEYYARRLAQESDVVVLPTVPFGYYPAFVEYPGSVNLGRATFRDTIVEICTSLAAQVPGLHFYVLNTGISTLGPLKEAQATLAALKIPMVYSDPETPREILAKISQQARGSHADEIETSVMMVITPEKVKLERAKRDCNPDRPGILTRDPHSAAGVYSPTGAWGDPTLATREKGEILVRATLEQHLHAVQRLHREAGVSK